MATYCYSREGEPKVVEAEFPMGAARPFIVKDGKTFMRDIGAEHRNIIDLPSLDGEIRTMSMGCHPDQAAEFTANAHKHGCKNTHFDPRTGEGVWNSKGAKKKYCRTFGIRDFDGGLTGP